MNCMNILTNIRIRIALGAVALALCVPAQAAVDTFTFSSGFTPGSWTDGSGLVDQHGFTDNRGVGGVGSVIETVGLTLTFAENTGVTAPSIMTGLLTLRNLDTVYGTYTLNNIAATSSGASYAFTANVSSSFLTFNPNNTWSLALNLPSGNSVENTLQSWSLEIGSVPEPINVALGVFGAVFAAVAVGRRLRTKAQGRA